MTSRRHYLHNCKYARTHENVLFLPSHFAFCMIIIRILQMERIADENIIVARSFESAMELLQDMENVETVWNIGGREVYELGLKSPLLHQVCFCFSHRSVVSLKEDFSRTPCFALVQFSGLSQPKKNTV